MCLYALLYQIKCQNVIRLLYFIPVNIISMGKILLIICGLLLYNYVLIDLITNLNT